MNIEGYDEELEYIATFIKGKGHPTVYNYRILTRGVKTGIEKILMLVEKDHFFTHKKTYEIYCNQYFKVISPSHLKVKNYNYYKLGYDLSTVDKFFTTWIESDPSVTVKGYFTTYVSLVKNYTWTFKFNNKIY